jgi:flagellar biosynthesis GTPase FlhF
MKNIKPTIVIPIIARVSDFCKFAILLRKTLNICLEKMNYTVIALGLWCVMQVFIAIWGLGIMNNNCQNLSLYSRLRTLLTISAVTATIFFANLMCNQVCYEGNENTSIWVALFTFVSSIIIISLEVQIKNDINDCAKNTENYKLVVLYGGVLPSIFPLLYSLYMIYTWFSTVKERRALVEREKSAKRRLLDEQRQKKEDDEAAEKTRSAEEAENKANAMKAEREAKRKQQLADDAARARQATEKAVASRKKQQDEVRKKRGEFTPEEIVEQAKEKRKADVIAKGKQKVDKLEQEIRRIGLAPGEKDEERLVRLGEQLSRAKNELKDVEEGERERYRQRGVNFPINLLNDI